MFHYDVKNVNHLFPLIINDIQRLGVIKESRAGRVLEYPMPVAVTYRNPTQRVLFDRNRLCNPFFNFIEGLWIINGSRDVKFLDYFNSQMKQYSDNGVDFYGAYGHRLRHNFGVDQIKLAISKLKANHDDRRVYMSMWDPDLDLGKSMKDHPCNVGIALKVRNNQLDMTVFCRSNDALYGLMSANVSHMTMLMEYIAGCVGVGVGTYNSVSDSCHVYVDVPVWSAVKDTTSYIPDDRYSTEYPELAVKPFPMMRSNPVAWHEDLIEFMLDPFYESEYQTAFFRDVAYPIALTWKAHKDHNDGLSVVDEIKATDWRAACRQWLEIKEKKSA